MGNTRDRILQYLSFKGINKKHFYDASGLSNGFLDKTLNPGTDKLDKILNAFPDINLYWLVTGMGQMIVKPDAPARLPKKYVEEPMVSIAAEPQEPYITLNNRANVTGNDKSAPKTAPKHASNQKSEGATLHPRIITVDRAGNENILWVPVRARAGYLLGFGDPEFMEQLPSFNLPGLPQGTYRAFEVDGDSMFPTLKNREMVIGQSVERLEHIRDDRVYIIVTKNDGVLIKRVLNRIAEHGLLILKSDAIDNRDRYPNIRVRPEDIQELWYAVWHGGFDFTSPSDTWQRINNHEAELTVLNGVVAHLSNILRDAGLLK